MLAIHVFRKDQHYPGYKIRFYAINEYKKKLILFIGRPRLREYFDDKLIKKHPIYVKNSDNGITPIYNDNLVGLVYNILNNIFMGIRQSYLIDQLYPDLYQNMAGYQSNMTGYQSNMTDNINSLVDLYCEIISLIEQVNTMPSNVKSARN